MIKVLITDDSPLVCAMIREVFAQDNRFEVIGTAHNGKEAIQKNEELNPDLIIMDINMPVLNGIEATKYILQDNKVAIIAFTTEEDSDIGYKCIEAGALEMIRKPSLIRPDDSFFGDFLDRVYEIAFNYVKIYRKRDVQGRIIPAVIKNESSHDYDILLIGASTGGPSAIQKLLKGLGQNFPLPILVTQHIDSFFDTQFVKWLNQTTAFNVVKAEDSMEIKKGTVYIAPADFHLGVKRNFNGVPVLELNQDSQMHFLRPAVDKMFLSAAKIYKDRSICVILTGMGRDGAEGMAELYRNGSYTIAESEESCVVYGMPKACIDAGCVKTVLPLEEIATFIISKTETLTRTV